MTTTPLTSTQAPAVPKPPGTRWALAWVESRRLLFHPIFLLAIAYSSIEWELFARQGVRETDMLPLLNALGPSGVVAIFLVAFLAISRERRDEAHDIYAAQPVTPRLRTQAALLSIAPAALAGAAAITLTAVGLDALDGQIAASDQRYYALQPLELAHGPLNLMLAGTLGVLLGSWTHRLTAAALALILLFFPIGLLWPSLTSANEIFVVGLFPAVLPKAGGAALVIALSGLIALTAAGALARHDRRPAIGALALMALGVLSVPVSAAAAAIAAMLACIVLLWPPSANDQPTPTHNTHR